jgi:broad specificity phosphatase PhoE
MYRYVARHGFSAANNRDNFGTPAFGNPDAPLEELGREQARLMGYQLKNEFGINLRSTAVAVSSLRRSQETAQEAGFHKLRIYSQLDEIEHGLSYEELGEALQTASPPQTAFDAVDLMINDPPPEGVWVTHALRIATLCRVQNVYQDARFLPKFGEIRSIPV